MLEPELMDNVKTLATPYVMGVLILVFAFWIKDFAVKMAQGISFKLNGAFSEGDKVILDGEKALIVKIGVTQTVFGITKEGGEWDGDYVWRYVPNERIPFLRLEKVVFDHTPNHNSSRIDKNEQKIEEHINNV